MMDFFNDEPAATFEGLTLGEIQNMTLRELREYNRVREIEKAEDELLRQLELWNEYGGMTFKPRPAERPRPVVDVTSVDDYIPSKSKYTSEFAAEFGLPDA